MASSGTFDCRRQRRRRCCRSSRPPSTPTGTARSSRPYDPERDRDRLDDALSAARGQREPATGSRSRFPGLEVRPFPYQQEMLDAIEVERVRARPAPQPRGRGDRHRKDRRCRLGLPTALPLTANRPRLLFVAHRREILEQSLRTYREVLGDGDFGELYVGGARPERWQHVFASVQSLTSYGVANIPARRLRHRRDRRVPPRRGQDLSPTPRPPSARPSCLGLTATPERADGIDVRSFFDGRTAAELRLWDALGADLLCPFHYFVAADGTDLRSIAWSRGQLRRGRAGQRLHRQRRPRPHRPQPAARQGVGRRRHARPGVLRQRRARRVHGRSLQRRRHPGPGRQWADPAHGPRPGPRRPARTATSTSSSPPTCSTRASTSPRSTPCCSSGPPKARPSSFSSSAAAFDVRRTRRS